MLGDDDEPRRGTEETPAEAQARKFQRELSAGLTSLVLLSVLADADTDLYGYEIARRLSSDDAAEPRRSSRARCTRCCAT